MENGKSKICRDRMLERLHHHQWRRRFLFGREQSAFDNGDGGDRVCLGHYEAATMFAAVAILPEQLEPPTAI